MFVYLLNQSRGYYLFPVLVLIYRWNPIESLSWFSSLTPLLCYALLTWLFLTKQLSIENMLFSLLYLICRPHNCFLIIIHVILYRYLKVTDARLAFLLSQAAFFHLVRIKRFPFHF